jgi:glutamin-(asparagin-)ase
MRGVRKTAFVRNATQPDDRYNWFVADDQVPHKARILMMVALTGDSDSQAQLAFVSY